MKNIYLGALIVAGAAMMATGYAKVASAGEWGKYQVGDRRSGITYATPETRSMQEDDVENPGMSYVDTGADLWKNVDGKAGKACASCHNDAAKSMKGVGTTFPKYNPDTKKMKSLEQQINSCRTERMKATAWKHESGQMLAMNIFVRHQSNGMPMNVSIDGPAVPFFVKGKEFFDARRGALDMSCKNCHVDNAGNRIRANLLSEGQSNGFPTYRFKWQKPGSIHRRFRGCNKNVRAKPYDYDSDEYVNLELYVAWRGRGLPVETPAVRN